MHDTGRTRTVPIPPASIYDAALRGFDRQVLYALCDHADWRDFTTDHCAVQLAQDFNVARQNVTRAIKRIVQAGYLVSLGRNHRHAHVYRIVMDRNPPKASQVMHPPASQVIRAASQVMLSRHHR